MSQVIEGIRQAQGGKDGNLVNAQILGNIPLGDGLANAGALGVISRVNFDVMVSAETSGSGGVKLVVFGVGGEAGGQHKVGTANRVSFSVPVRLPDGDPSRREQVLERRKTNASARRARITGRIV
ncbi:MAG TPA: hypothetical protein VIN06_06795 [Devosia sp.]